MPKSKKSIRSKQTVARRGAKTVHTVGSMPTRVNMGGLITNDDNQTTIEQRKQNQSLLSQKNQIQVAERMQQYQWSLGHLYPDIYEPVRFPDQYQFPTHLMRSPFQRTLTIPSTKDFAIYFSPLTDCYYNYQFGAAGQMYSNINVNWGNDVFISYADNGSARTDATTGKNVFDTANGKNDLFTNLGNWNYTAKGSDSLKKFKKIRLLAAYLKLTYTGKSDELSGTVRVAMGVRNFTTPFLNDQINIDDLINMPQYQTFKLREPIICRYRVTNEDFMDFGPYSPYSSIPYFIIYGKGLQENSSVFVEIVKHYEGVVIPEEEEFASQTRANMFQLPGLSQLGFVKNVGGVGAIDVHRKLKENELDDLYMRD